MSKSELIVTEKCAEFCETVCSLANYNAIKPLTGKQSGFPVLIPNNSAFNLQQYFAEIVEYYIWRKLVNEIFGELLLEYGYDVEWQKMHPQISFGYLSDIENRYPFEFVIDGEGVRTAYRYTTCAWQESAWNRLFDNAIDKMVVIDFSDQLTPPAMLQFGVPERYAEKYEIVKLEKWFSDYFSVSLYTYYLEKVKEAISYVYKKIGLQTIPNLTRHYLPSFIEKSEDEIGQMSFYGQAYLVLNHENERLKDDIERIDASEGKISQSDYDVLYTNFKINQRYLSLFGINSYAKSFVTAEYLYHTILSNNYFDYTAIVSGYIKSIEQLLYYYLLFRLNKGEHQDKWIKAAQCPKNPNPYYFNTRNNPRLARFCPENESYFDTTFGSLRWFLVENNLKDWEVSNETVVLLNSMLKVYAAECRNEHFHKDNITEVSIVKTIRNNTLLLLFFLLGGYSLSGTISEKKTVLGITDNVYDRFYRAIMKVSGGGDYFIMEKTDGTTDLVAFPFNQVMPVFDDFGRISNPSLRFVSVCSNLTDWNSYPWSDDDWQMTENDTRSDNVILITSENIPVSMKKVEKISGKTIPVKW